MENMQQVSSNDITGISQDVAQTSEGQLSKEPDLILGKFKSVEDLTNAYKNIESQHGQQSKEIGELRKKAEKYDNYQKEIIERDKNYSVAKEYLSKSFEKYNKTEYFSNKEFQNLFREAFSALGPSLNLDKFVELVDGYVNARISMYEKIKLAKSENEKAKESIQFSNSFSKEPIKSLPKIDTLPVDKIDEFVAKHI